MIKSILGHIVMEAYNYFCVIFLKCSLFLTIFKQLQVQNGSL